MGRLSDLIHFYQILARLERNLGGKRILADCHGRMAWPERGVYFFFEGGETRSDSGDGLRVVRVGTHALTETSKTTLWNRLSQHQGALSTGQGNHRGSIFRKLLGSAIMSRDNLSGPQSWGVKNDPGSAARSLGQTRKQVVDAERSLETAVSEYIRQMPFLYLTIDDASGPRSGRSAIERSAISLLSNYEKATLDRASTEWLGNHCDRQRVRLSGLWNNHYVDDSYDAGFLGLLEHYVEQMGSHGR